ncbi:MAG: hypothetical protein EA411_04010 [Saprospirales bacterium]|nr:MAG: hypothetical protein EA411_04010 [Saprospirales bacterium]
MRYREKMAEKRPMKLMTPVKIPEPKQQIGLKEGVFCMGSCFADHITRFFQQRKIPVHANPGGITYNPISISHWLNNLVGDSPPRTEEVFEYRGLYHHFQFHGSFSRPGRDAAYSNMLESHIKSRERLLNAKHLILTFGTAYTFSLRENGEVVSNCHKLPGTDFDRTFHPPHLIRDKLVSSFHKLFEVNPDLHIILTVSPIRHLRDGLINNSRSKSSLIIAVQYLQEEFPDRLSYFPAYEIEMDELRDYRFYGEDMTHPTQQAVSYILKKFTVHYLTPEVRDFAGEAGAISTAVNHRPLHPGSEDHRAFVKAQFKKIDQLSEKYPFVDWSEEREYFRASLG